LGYLCGSIPFAIWITRLVKGVDVRDAGSFQVFLYDYLFTVSARNIQVLP
jgi:hypothetical protein